ncbi:glycoside hydrolase family 43 protein [Halalkalibacter sp. APA_J-10(15)]|uniref:glycoside hydrolase family 43 protein n=1 Tax=Halalkalibacter sp. APA_J-10(15) TaxID=2933805 RepID=UPI001FF4AC25|nr:glycoside hydrolase family 43 protein [Halalkalibacter sp. APA_J-10(15)]MCK0473380.1 glycoside hydrolase family 43 protein [Halalkalibacter sp. APA_J-10(15)]
MKHKNLVISGFHPDPSVCKVGEEYYLVTSSFEYFPGVPIYHSVNLVNWKQIGYVLTQESQLPLTRIHSYTTSQGIYAPTIRYHNARFYVITTNVTVGKTFYVWAEDPNGPWSEPVVIENLRGFDPSLFFDDDGKVYLTYAHFPGFGNDGIFQAELDIDTGRLLNEPVLIWHGTGGHSPEGPHLYKINGWYYLLIAEGGTEYGHMVTVARSRKPFGEYESCPNNPIVSNRSSDKPIQGTGHADLVQDHNGEWWSVMLGFRPVKTSKLHHLGRETNLAPVAWDEDGWPSIGLNGQVDVEYDARSLKVVNKEKGEDREDFSNHNLSLEWNFYRNPLAESWSLTEKPDRPFCFSMMQYRRRGNMSTARQ